MDWSTEGIKDYPNELDILQQADDVDGNGVFDPAGSHGNVHGDYGVFADHVSLPGYVERDRFYQPSEVIDATTGNKVVYVPGGAVAIDRAQRRAFRQLDDFWELPPSMNPFPTEDLAFESTVIPDQPAWPVGQANGDANGGMPTWLKYSLATVAIGAALGVGVAIARKR